MQITREVLDVASLVGLGLGTGMLSMDLKNNFRNKARGKQLTENLKMFMEKGLDVNIVQELLKNTADVITNHGTGETSVIVLDKVRKEKKVRKGLKGIFVGR